MKKIEQHDAAKELYFLGWEQSKISRLVGVSEQSISQWVNKENWKAERALKYSLNDSISNQLLELIDYQLTAIRERIKRMKEEGGELKLIDKGEVDALSKLFAGVKQKDIQWTHYVNVNKELVDYVAMKDPEFAKQLVQFTDGFLMYKRESLI